MSIFVKVRNLLMEMMDRLSLKARLLFSILSVSTILLIISVSGYLIIRTLTDNSIISYQAFSLNSYVTTAVVNKEILDKELSLAVAAKESKSEVSADNIEMYLEVLGDSILDYSGEAASLNFSSSEIESEWNALAGKIENFVSDPEALDKNGIEKIREDLSSYGDLLQAQSEKIEGLIMASYKTAYFIDQILLQVIIGVAAITLIFIMISFLIISRTSSSLFESQQLVDKEATGLEGVTSVLKEAFAKFSGLSESQASSLQETSASLHEVIAMIEKNTSATEESAEFSNVLKENVDSGKESLDAGVQSIEGLKKLNDNFSRVVEDSSAKVRSIIEAINEISEKTKVINDIVFQTKLLSFNASVEAARAGEHGKGFAVVAEEVGNLAQMSGKSSGEISGLLEKNTAMIENIISEYDKNLGESIKESKKYVESTYTNINECNDKFADIKSSVDSISAQIINIKTASQEQDQGAQEINKAIQQLAASGQEVSSVSTNASHKLETLVDASNSLGEAAHSLECEVQGTKTANEEEVA
jgi:methyl-accepting chemotaxis protein